ncbi:MAG: DUF4097 family beta strand repeat protein [Acidobacteriia bacterium]|nr:DUF4097 family beta strand repeat protein [Terriglobia bacterium]
MRPRSLTTPLILVMLGAFFLWRNLHPEAPVFDLIANYWPFLLIAWGFIRLLEVLVWRASRYPGVTGGEVVLVVFICLGGMGLFEVHRHGIRLTPAIFGEQFEYPVSSQMPAAGIKRIVLDTPRGSIHLTGGETGQISVSGQKQIRAYTREDADRTNGRTQLEMTVEGDRLLIRSHQDRAPAEQRISDDLELTVPRDVAIEGRAGNTDFDISDVNGAVELRSGRGDVHLARIGGNVRLDIGRSAAISASDIHGNLDIAGQGSDVQVDNVTGQVTLNGAYVGSLEFHNLSSPLRVQGARNLELRAAAVPGTISTDLSDLTADNVLGPIHLVTRSRDVHFENFTDSLELETDHGDVELEPGRMPLPRIDAHSTSGEIELALPENAEFQLQATAERGEAVNDFGSPINTQVEGRRAMMTGAVGSGPSIRITSDRGAVAVRKQGSAPSVRVPQPPRPPAPPRPPR